MLVGSGNVGVRTDALLNVIEMMPSLVAES